MSAEAQFSLTSLSCSRFVFIAPENTLQRNALATELCRRASQRAGFRNPDFLAHPSGHETLLPRGISFRHAKPLLYVPGQMLIYLCVTRHRLFQSVRRVPVNVVPASGTKKEATLCRQLANQFSALHTRTSLN